MRCSEFCPPEIEVVRGSLLEAALGGGGNMFTIWQSGGDDGEAWVIGVLPLFGVGSRSGVRCLIGVRALSGVRDRSEVRGIGDWLCPGSNRPGALPPHLGRAGPFQGSSGTGRSRAASLLAGSSSRWRIVDQGDFTNYFVEGPGW